VFGHWRAVSRKGRIQLKTADRFAGIPSAINAFQSMSPDTPGSLAMKSIFLRKLACRSTIYQSSSSIDPCEKGRHDSLGIAGPAPSRRVSTQKIAANG